MTTASIRILCKIVCQTVTVRLWDGAGPYVDQDGEVWRGCAMNGIDVVESAINGEAYTLDMGLTGIPSEISALAWQDYESGEIIGAAVQLLIQPCDEFDQPVGDYESKFNGRIDNVRFADTAQDERVVSDVIAECTNRFTLRRLTNGSVLSDTDQRARAHVLNPSGNPDRFCERVPSLRDKQIVWPRFN